MVRSEPSESVSFERGGEIDELVGVRGGGAANHIVLDGIAFDTASVEIVGIVFALRTKDEREACSVR